MRIIKNEILHEYADIISMYKSINYIPIPQEDNYPIWVMWWQGENKMPEVVKICYASILKNAGSHPVNLITNCNYEKYLDGMPYLENLITRVNNNSLSVTHFSDICRCWLIYTYGGFWVDATILLTDNIDNVVTNKIFVSCIIKNRERHPGYLDCSAFFFYCSKHNPMYKFVYEVLTKHVLNHNEFICYFMINYCILIAYEQFDYARYTISQSPIFPNYAHYFVRVLANRNHLNDAFNEKRFLSITKKIPFLKLSYKFAFDEYTENGRLTYYGYIKRRFLSNSIIK